MNEIDEYLKNLTLLVVEDSKTTQVLVESVLEDFCKNIILADDGESGLEEFEKNEVDIVLTDYEMPKKNGIEMVREIKSIDKEVPIILISAIDDVDMIIEGLRAGVDNFVRKPIDYEILLDVIEDAAKIVMANHLLQEQRERKEQEISKLEEKNSYYTQQEDLGFAKELNILRNDFYYQMNMSDGITLIDFIYQPLDIISGDAYSARRIDEHKTFYLMVDGMGKGLSASLTAMIMTSFVNYYVDKMLEEDRFDLHKLIDESITYIRPVLLEEEALAIDYVLIDYKENKMGYSKFATPPMLLHNTDEKIIKLRSNNPPLSKYTPGFQVTQEKIADVKKFLIYSDGIVENTTKYNGLLYDEFIEEDFRYAFTREEFRTSFFEKIERQEDDITVIFIHRLVSSIIEIESRRFDTSLEEVDEAGEWYSALWDRLTHDKKTASLASLAFTELFMNAYEHGNLAIDAHEKHKMLDEDTYFDTLLEREAEVDKKIYVKVSKVESVDSYYIITEIHDEGDGFDTQELSAIFRNSHTFNGRGVFVSRKNSHGIYYNAKGNMVIFINKIAK